MSESENDRNEAASGRVPSPGPPVVPDDDAADRSTDDTDETKDESIPGEEPEDNPDLTGEDRFDAG